MSPRRLFRAVFGGLLALALIPSPARAQFVYGRTVLPNPTPDSWEYYGAVVFFVGDLTGDGTQDYVLTQDGQVELHDGGSHATIRSTAVSTYGAGVVRALTGDVDGDGVPDFAVGKTLVSSATGQVLVTLASPTPEDTGGFGSDLVAFGDTDGDGRSEVAVGAPGEFGGGVRSGQVHVFSGATGALLRTTRSPAPAYQGAFGTSLVATGDVDGDGTPDFAVEAPQEPESESARGHVYVFSGASGALLHTLAPPGVYDTFPYNVPTLYDVGDQTGDGVSELGVSRYDASAGSPPYWRVFVYDGATGLYHRTLAPPPGTPGSFGSFGRPVASLGDRTGDGRDEVAVSLYDSDGLAGRVFVYDGASGAILETLTDPGNGTFSDNGTQFGLSLAGGADLDGDGLGDLLVGAPGWDTRDANGNPKPSSGRLYLYTLRRAPDDRRDFGIASPALVFLDAPGGWARFATPYGLYDSDTGAPVASYPPPGSAVARTGDLDGDGTDDLVLGVETSDGPGGTNSGSVRLVSGATGTGIGADLVSPTPQPGGAFGREVAGGADLDGDGTDDFAVGSLESVLFEDDGRVHVVSGADRSLLYSVVSPAAVGAGEFGRALVFVPDLDGDGRAELVVGAPGESVGGVPEAGVVHVVSGATGAWLYSVPTPNPLSEGRFGHALAALGDTDGDGTADFAVGAVRESGGGSRAGRVYLVSGATGAILQILRSPQVTTGGRFGTSLSSGGDADGDGAVDLLVGASLETGNGVAASGAAYLFGSSTWTAVLRYVSPFPEADGRFGFAVALGDADGDGRADALVGATEEDDFIVGGHTYLFLTPETFPVAAEAPQAAPAGLAVEAIWPNPAQGATRLRYALAAPADVRVGVFDALGRRVLALEAGTRTAGRHEAALDVSALATGVYVVRVEAGGGVAVRRLSIVR